LLKAGSSGIGFNRSESLGGFIKGADGSSSSAKSSCCADRFIEKQRMQRTKNNFFIVYGFFFTPQEEIQMLGSEFSMNLK
jgi:hypothetical protein